MNNVFKTSRKKPSQRKINKKKIKLLLLGGCTKKVRRQEMSSLHSRIRCLFMLTIFYKKKIIKLFRFFRMTVLSRRCTVASWHAMVPGSCPTSSAQSFTSSPSRTRWRSSSASTRRTSTATSGEQTRQRTEVQNQEISTIQSKIYRMHVPIRLWSQLKPSFTWPLSIIYDTRFQTLKKYLRTYESISVS